MKKTVWGTALAFTCAMTVGVLAQPPQTPPSSGQDRGTVTVVGCLKSADTAMSGTTATPPPPTGTPSASPSAPTYVLTNAKVTAGGGAMTGGATGTGATGTAGATAAANMYRLTLSGTTDDLKPHVNHQIEISGTMGSAGAAAAGTGTTGGTTGATGTGALTKENIAKAPELRVRSVKMLSATCPME